MPRRRMSDNDRPINAIGSRSISSLDMVDKQVCGVDGNAGIRQELACRVGVLAHQDFSQNAVGEYTHPTTKLRETGVKMSKMNQWLLPFVLLATPAFLCAQTTQPSTPPTAEMANQLLSAGGGAKPLPSATRGPMTDSSTGKAAVAPGAPTLNVMREGTFIVKRVGRLTHSADGQQMEFTFDSDRKTMKDPPVVILPNLKLMQMENAIAGSSRDLRFRVSGLVTEYKGRNYVLLDQVVVVPDIDQQF
jgi:hypothetical protein